MIHHIACDSGDERRVIALELRIQPCKALLRNFQVLPAQPPEILIKRVDAVDRRQSSLGGEIAAQDALQPILGKRVAQTVVPIFLALRKDVGHTPVVANDGDFSRPALDWCLRAYRSRGRYYSQRYGNSSVHTDNLTRRAALMLVRTKPFASARCGCLAFSHATRWAP